MNRENELLSWTMWEYIFEPLYFLLRGQLCSVMEGFIEVAEYSHDIEWALGTDREKTFISKTNWPLCYTFFVLSMRVFCMTRKSFMPRRYKWFLMVLAAFHFPPLYSKLLSFYLTKAHVELWTITSIWYIAIMFTGKANILRPFKNKIRLGKTNSIMLIPPKISRDVILKTCSVRIKTIKPQFQSGFIFKYNNI